MTTRPMPLCSQCGTEFGRLSEHELRCPACGLGATTSPLVMSRRSATEPDWEMVERAAVARADADLARFRAAPFAVFGLDDRWTGLRWFGGHGSSNGRLCQLTLAYGENPTDDHEPHVRVETCEPQVIRGDPVMDSWVALWSKARTQIDWLWYETGAIPEATRRAAFADGGLDSDAWEMQSIPVNGVMVEFRTMAAGHSVIANALVDELVVGVECHRWFLTDLGLVTTVDIEPYADGSRVLARRWRDTFGA
jgi:hypothetical protein